MKIGNSKKKMIDIELYWHLSPNSQKAIRRLKKQWGHPVYYKISKKVVSRLAKKLNRTETDIEKQLLAERTWFEKYPKYPPYKD